MKYSVNRFEKNRGKYDCRENTDVDTTPFNNGKSPPSSISFLTDDKKNIMVQKDDGGEEESFDIPLYETIKRDLIFIGQFPYQSVRSHRLFYACALLSMGSLVIPQFMQVVNEVCSKNFDGIMTSALPLMTNLICFIKIINLQCHRKTIRKLFDLIKWEWTTVKTEEELDILRQYATQGNLFANFYRCTLLVFFVLFSGLPLASIVLDLVAPLNETRPRKTMFEVDYIVTDAQDHFYLLYAQSIWSAMCTVMTAVAVDSMYMLIVHHACALFTLCGYRVIRMTENLKKDFNGDARTSKVLLEETKYCIISHKRAIEYSEMIAGSYTKGCLLQVGMNMISISMLGIAIIINADKFDEVVRYIIFAVANHFHLFYNSLPGQKLIDHSTELSNSIYSSKWYRLSVEVQRMLILIQIRAEIPCKLSAAGIYDVNIENFVIVMKTSMSYFTMFLSLRE